MSTFLLSRLGQISINLFVEAGNVFKWGDDFGLYQLCCRSWGKPNVNLLGVEYQSGPKYKRRLHWIIVGKSGLYMEPDWSLVRRCSPACLSLAYPFFRHCTMSTLTFLSKLGHVYTNHIFVEAGLNIYINRFVKIGHATRTCFGLYQPLCRSWTIPTSSISSKVYISTISRHAAGF